MQKAGAASLSQYFQVFALHRGSEEHPAVLCRFHLLVTVTQCATIPFMPPRLHHAFSRLRGWTIAAIGSHAQSDFEGFSVYEHIWQMTYSCNMQKTSDKGVQLHLTQMTSRHRGSKHTLCSGWADPDWRCQRWCGASHWWISELCCKGIPGGNKAQQSQSVCRAFRVESFNDWLRRPCASSGKSHGHTHTHTPS